MEGIIVSAGRLALCARKLPLTIRRSNEAQSQALAHRLPESYFLKYIHAAKAISTTVMTHRPILLPPFSASAMAKFYL